MLAPLLVALLSMEAPAPARVAHPLHSALTEIEYQPGSESVLIRVRVFRDDLTAVIAPALDRSPPDSAWSRYARGTLGLTSQDGRPLRLRWVGAEQTGDTI